MPAQRLVHYLLNFTGAVGLSTISFARGVAAHPPTQKDAAAIPHAHEVAAVKHGGQFGGERKNGEKKINDLVDWLCESKTVKGATLKKGVSHRQNK